VFVYDKRGKDAGFFGFFRQVGLIRSAEYQCAVIPHRSLRSAVLARFAGIPRRIGFDTGSGRRIMTDLVPYAGYTHEISLNLSLLVPLGITPPAREKPVLIPSDADRVVVEKFFLEARLGEKNNCIAIAPGSVWNTKRWPPERYALLASLLIKKGFRVVLAGGTEDSGLCRQVARQVTDGTVAVAAGMFTLLQSAELIRRCAVLVSNDSAPVHLAVAMQTPVVAIFGATVPEFGFAPYGNRDRVVQEAGLACKPCSIHGGAKCPIGTFDCMLRITPERVLEEILTLCVLYPT
jgi:heptosyltransferase II